MPTWVAILLLSSLSGALVYAFIQKKIADRKIAETENRIQATREKREAEISRRMYELAILKELGERIGYSLNIENIVDIITGSLHQFIEYSAASYMLLGGERIVFKIHLEKSVSRNFIDDVRNRMLKSLSALVDREFSKNQVEEVLSGAILLEEVDMPVRSFFNIPLVIRDKVVGVLTVAHTISDLYKEEEMTILYKITQQASKAVARLEEVVETEERKLNAMVESISEGVVMTDNDYRVLVVNPAARNLLNLAGKEEISIFDLIDHLEGKFDIRGKLEESIKLDKTIELSETVINDRFFQIFVAPVKSMRLGEKEILGAVTIFHDITHDKELEKLRDDFSAMMVHELRSPLVGIKNLMELITKSDAVTRQADLRENLALIGESSSRMLELVNDLLDVAKLEAGKFETHLIPSDIPALIKDRIAFFKPTAEKSKLSLDYSFASGIPLQINCDPKLIAEALNNLISNALKFTPPGGRIMVQALKHAKNKNIIEEAKQAEIIWHLSDDEENISGQDDSLLIAVTDSGIGIPKENITKLFSKFKQFGFGSITEKKGTGLGLVIVKGIIENHHGKVGVASKEGQGSTFYFTLPISSPVSNETSPETLSIVGAP